MVSREKKFFYLSFLFLVIVFFFGVFVCCELDGGLGLFVWEGDFVGVWGVDGEFSSVI